MHTKLTWELRKLTVIEENKVSFLNFFTLNVSIMLGLFSIIRRVILIILRKMSL